MERRRFVMSHTTRAGKESSSGCHTCGRFIPEAERVIHDDKGREYCTELCKRTWQSHETLVHAMEIGFALAAGRGVPNAIDTRA